MTHQELDARSLALHRLVAEKIRRDPSIRGEREFVVLDRLEAHDLAASKLAAHREKDLSFVATMLAHEIVDPAVLTDRIDRLPMPVARAQQLKAWIARTAASPGCHPTPDRDGPDVQACRTATERGVSAPEASAGGGEPRGGAARRLAE